VAKIDFVLVDQNIFLPADGRGLCSFFDFVMPTTVATGIVTILVNDTAVGTLVVK
jgi:hypothetical protein